LYPATFLRHFLVEFFQSFKWSCHLQIGIILIFLSYFNSFISSPGLIALVRNSKTMLNNNGESRHPCLISDFRRNGFSVSPGKMVAMDLLYIVRVLYLLGRLSITWAISPALICVRYIPDKVSPTIYQGWLQTATLLIFASWVAKITGMRHGCWLMSFYHERMSNFIKGFSCICRNDHVNFVFASINMLYYI
jgi:hypothetical protein